MPQPEASTAYTVPVHHQPVDAHTAAVMAQTATQTQRILATRWALPTPRRCQMFVLTDCREFIDASAPGFYRPLIALSRPLWRARAERIFALAGGWNIPWRGAPAVGVKPPRLLPKDRDSLGARLFQTVDDADEKTRRLTCHELTHAFTAHLRLPAWLNEGLAMRAVDHLISGDSLLAESRQLVSGDATAIDPSAYRKAAADSDGLVRFYANAYWRTRALDEAHHDELTELLSQRRSAQQLRAWTERWLSTLPA